LSAKGFSCLLDISKLQFLIKKDFKKFSAVFFLSKVFGHQHPESGLDPYPYPYPNPDSLEMLDPDSMNPDPQLWILVFQFSSETEQTMHTSSSRCQ
jgi:hypothetical protein